MAFITQVSTEGDVALPIAALEREIGISKDVLRKWEARYGFPVPERDAAGERIYPPDQVARLRLVKRLLDAGMRPSRVVAQPYETLLKLAESAPEEARGDREAAHYAAFLLELRQHDTPGLRRRLIRDLYRDGVSRFVQDTMPGLIRFVGAAWARGELEVHEEHHFSEVAQGVLRNVIDDLNDARGRPRILLTTLPGEHHGMGLQLVAALAALEGAHCISLGTETPLHDIRSAVEARSIDIVALSFSSMFPARQVGPAVTSLKDLLPDGVEVLVGGSGAARLATELSGIARIDALAALPAAIEDWRSRQGD